LGGICGLDGGADAPQAASIGNLEAVISLCVYGASGGLVSTGGRKPERRTHERKKKKGIVGVSRKYRCGIA
jgi:hypothetical protein